jgi:thymidine phosphorylase
MGKRVVALITSMDQPLGWAVGNALEVEECIGIMRGEDVQNSRDLKELTLELAAWMFFLGERTASMEEGKRLAAQLLSSGKGLEKFREMVRLQAGDSTVADDIRKLPQARSQIEVRSKSHGYVTNIDCEKLGLASLALGGGRERKEDSIDAAVGLTIYKKIGKAVAVDEALCTLHYNSAARLEEAMQFVEAAYVVGAQQVPPPRLIHRVIGAEPLAAKSAPQTVP